MGNWTWLKSRDGVGGDERSLDVLARLTLAQQELLGRAVLVSVSGEDELRFQMSEEHPDGVEFIAQRVGVE